jgi:hypothetical protein
MNNDKGVQCPKCGKYFDHRGFNMHIRYCAPGDITQEDSSLVEAQISADSGDAKVMFTSNGIRISDGIIITDRMSEEEPSLPLSICPPELSYMSQGQQFLRVAGRVKGDRFVVEQVKLWGRR